MTKLSSSSETNPSQKSSAYENSEKQPAGASLHDFYGRDFLITPDTLTPRPETEQLIDLVLSLAGKPYLPGMRPSQRRLPKQPTILDVGTGSGCIAITLALELPDAKVYASDLSQAALDVAAQNLQRHHLDFPLFLSHLLRDLADMPTPDLIVANLPYVDETWPWVDQAALSVDPEMALYAADGGLALIKRLIEQCQTHQIPRLILEADPIQHPDILRFASDHLYELEQNMGFILALKHG